MIVDEIKNNNTTINKVDKIVDDKNSLWEKIKESLKVNKK